MGYSPGDRKESDMTEQLTYTHIHILLLIKNRPNNEL